MPKNIEDVIIPEKKRTIRDIPIPEGRRRNPPNFGIPPPIPPERRTIEPRRGGRKGLWITIVIALLIIAFAALSFFNGATLSYTPKSTDLVFENDSFTAKKTGEGLLFSVIKFSTDKGLEVSATGEEQVERKASGTIVVYNTTNQTQRFRSTTRFETPEGKVYQTPDAISIPAKGSIEIVVYAEKPGVEGNTGLADFTLPGLKGTSLATQVYARSKTEMTGGFAGIQRTITDEEKARVKADLEGKLREELVKEASAQVPEDFVLIPTLSSVTFEDLPQTPSSNESSTIVNMRGNLLGVMFKKTDLATRLVHQKKALAPGEVIEILDLSALKFAFQGTAPTNLTLTEEIRFNVSGPATAIWQTDEVALKSDLVGRHKRDIPTILNNYPSIVKATATIRPFWKSNFPAESSKITINKLPIK